MKRLYIMFIVLTCILTANAIIVETGSLRDFLYGQDSSFEYDNYLSHVSEGIASPNYNYYAPFDPQTNGFGDYLIPTSMRLVEWAHVTQVFTNQYWETAQELLDSYNFPYHVVQFNDTDYDRTYYMLREILNDDYDENLPSDPDDDVTGSFDYGWGLYIFNPQATNPVIVTVPCPNDNFISPVIGYMAFTKWDAAFLMIAGAGREVKWYMDQGSPYYNSKSLSDPSRVFNHPFNKCYINFDDYISLNYGRRPFSAQMHSYDWGDRHVGRANIQISAGYNRTNINLPVWDHSNNGQDLLNWSEEVIFPANTFGIHREVTRNEYYAIFNEKHNLYYNNNPATPVNTDIDLNCYSDNQQMDMANSDSYDYDVIDPFLHIIADELPEVYEQNENNYKWFYGYDPVTNTFNVEEIYTMTENYYGYWIDRIAENIDSFINIESDSPALEIPANFQVIIPNYNYLKVSWEPISDHNFKTYEILYSTEPLANNNFVTRNRYTDGILADQKTSQYVIRNLKPTLDYYIKLRAVDYSGTSVETAEIFAQTPAYNIGSFIASNDNSNVELRWNTYIETGISGYKVFKRDFGNENWEEASEFIPASNNPDQDENNYTWLDEDIQFGDYIQYKLVIYDTFNEAYVYENIVTHHNSEILSINVSSSVFSEAVLCYFGVSKEATDNFDSNIDVVSPYTGSLGVFFYEEDYHQPKRKLSKNIYSYIDITQDYIELPFRIYKNTNTGHTFTLSLNEDINSDRYSRKVWLKDENSQLIDLSIQNYTIFLNYPTPYKDYTIYYGNITPNIVIGESSTNRIYNPGETIEFNWSSEMENLLENYSVNLISPTDSLNITNLTNTNDSSFSWEIPQGTHIENAKIVIYSLVYDGEIIKGESKFALSILPTNMYYIFNSGWQLISHIWENNHPSLIDLFGAGTFIFELMPNEIYEPTLFYNFGKGYWVNIPEYNNSSNDFDIYKDQVTVDVHPGWNLLGNPYPTELELSSQTFNIANSTFTLSEMISYNYISRGIFTHTENGYEAVTSIAGMEGFLLYNNIEAPNEVTLTYAPYRNTIDMDLLPFNWTSQIIAEANGDKDNIVIGVSDYASDSQENNFDFRKAPNRPYEGVDIYLSYESQNNFTPNGQQDIKAIINEDEVKEWEFIVNARSLEPILLSFNSDDFPASFLYTALEFNGNSFHFDSDHDYEFTPSEIGEYHFKLKVAQNPLDNQNGDISPKPTYLNVYPNPFNPDTNISFDLEHEEKIQLTVYNLKGQKVKTLCNEVISSGRKTFVWNGNNNDGKQTASGIYFIKLDREGQKSKVKKVLLLK